MPEEASVHNLKKGAGPFGPAEQLGEPPNPNRSKHKLTKGKTFTHQSADILLYSKEHRPPSAYKFQEK